MLAFMSSTSKASKDVAWQVPVTGGEQYMPMLMA
jgi:hypothetical protein